MPAKCKLCTAPAEIRAKIEHHINQGYSAKETEKLATDLGVKISATSIQRHIENHTDFSIKTEAQSDSYSIRGDMEPIIDSIPQPQQMDWVQLDEFAAERFRQICANQLAIVEHKQIAYMKGEAKYPDKEIRSLCELAGIFSKSIPFSMETEAQ